MTTGQWMITDQNYNNAVLLFDNPAVVALTKKEKLDMGMETEIML